jgi:excinuclease ABC subunit A
MSIDEALEVFAYDTKITGRIAPLARVGIGYLQLGQPLATLSGGEHQRLRLALALSEGASGGMFVLDEPTTGLHPADIDVLLQCLDELIDDGGSVVVVEHNLDVIRRAGHVIDLGPEGGPDGGHVLFAGTPYELARCEASATGRALRSAGV